MPNVGPMELLVVAFIALIVLGPKRLPEVGRSLGRGMREFRESMAGLNDDADDDDRDAEDHAHDLDEKKPDEQQPAARA